MVFFKTVSSHWASVIKLLRLKIFEINFKIPAKEVSELPAVAGVRDRPTIGEILNNKK